MVDRLKRAKQKRKEHRIIVNANRLRSAPKKMSGSGRINKHEARVEERSRREGIIKK